MGLKYSIILPVFNAESTLRQCIDSVIDPSAKDLEIIIVDDGSNDGSLRICKEYAERFQQIKLFSKTNGGVSSARNYGIKRAEGEWILFLDSDDRYLPGWKAIVNQRIEESNVDFIQFAWKTKDGDRERLSSGKPAVCAAGIDKARAAAHELKNMRLNAPVAKAFRKSVIDQNGLTFPEELSIAEDLVFVFSHVLHSQKISICTDCIYCAHIENKDSLSRKKKSGLAERLLASDKKMRASLMTCPMDQDCKAIYQDALDWSYYRKAYTCCKELLKYNYSPVERWKHEKTICRQFDGKRVNASLWKTRLMSIPVRYRLVLFVDLMVRYKAKEGR